MAATTRAPTTRQTNQKHTPHGAGAQVYVYADTFEIITADIDTGGEIIRLCAVPAEAVLLRITVFHDDLDVHATETLTVNLGVYAAGGALDDIDGFASVVDWGDADITGTNLLWEAGASGGYSNIANVGKPIWEVVGDADASAGTYDIVATVGTGAATAQAGTVSFMVEYAL